ncbi:MAG TPA: aminopeptidase, partial [Spirochaetia bacterium]|nr:aminopeptidase [Spirochaetia bacterium]
MSLERDPRWVSLASVLLEHSTSVRPGDRLLIIMRETHCFPLAREVHRRAIELGAFPQTLFGSVLFDRDRLVLGTPEQVEWVPELFKEAMQWADVCVDLRGATNLYELSGVATQRVSRYRRAEGTISAIRTEGTRWVLVRVPNETLAQQ